MLDLTNGILDFGGISFGPETTLNNLKCSGLSLKVTENPSAGTALARATELVSVDGALFLPEFYFLNDLPTLVLLRPAIQYPPQMTSPAERQEMRYVACARWLFIRLGKPHSECPGEAKYDFSWGSASAVAHLLARDACDAGYIAVRYGR